MKLHKISFLTLLSIFALLGSLFIDSNKGYAMKISCDPRGAWQDIGSPSGGKQKQESSRKCSESICRTSSSDFPGMGALECSREGGTIINKETTQTRTQYISVVVPIDGGWSAWSSRIQIGDTNESNGSQPQQRTRSCNNPKPAHGGANCVGPSVERRNSGVAVDGGWTAWTLWQNIGPQNPDGTQKQIRSRTCTDPSPVNAGKYCEGNSTEYQTVKASLNGGWGAWSSWINVGVAVDGKQLQQRSRDCNNPIPAYGGLYCSGSSTEKRYVNSNSNDDGWYKRHTYPISGGKTECNYDGDNTGGSIIFKGGAKDWRVVSKNGSYITCDFYDKSKPTLSSIFLTPYANYKAEYRFVVNDKGGSGLKTVILYSKNLRTKKLTKITSWGGLNGVKSKSFTKEFFVGGEDKYQMVVSSIDIAGNSVNIEDTSRTLLVDKTKPKGSDISGSLVSSNYNFFRATNSQNFNWKISENKGAPIVSYKILFEKYDDKNKYLEYKYNNPNFNGNFNISLIDDNLISPNDSYRQYSVKVTEVTDAAGNVQVTPLNLQYNVYANIPSESKSNFNVSKLLDSNNVADGEARKVVLTLKDRYGNEIKSVKGHRTLTITPNYSNEVVLNQHSGSKEIKTAVYDSLNENSGYKKVEVKANYERKYVYSSTKSTTSGVYDIYYKIYAPTMSAYDKSKGDFVINNFGIKVNDKNYGAGGFTKNINKTAVFNPLIKSEITGEIDNFGIIEGATQNSELKMTKYSSLGEAHGISYYMNYTDNVSGKLYLNKNNELKNNLNELGDSEGLSSNNQLLLNNTLNLTQAFSTKYVAKNALKTKNDFGLHTYINYSIEGPTSSQDLVVTYETSKLGEKDNKKDLSLQSGINIKGASYLKNDEKTILEGQKTKIIKGEVDTLLVKKLIKVNVAKIKRSANLKDLELKKKNKLITNLSGVTLSGDGGIIANESGNVLYFGGEFNSNKLVKLKENLEISGAKTVIIDGGNLFIDKNLFYKNNKLDSIGFIVLKDKNGNGGNIYISPEVTNIVGAFYAEGSVISFDGTKELDGNTDYKTLKNQLHLFGTFMTQNTIGGSRKTPPECPYNVDECSTNDLDLRLQIAQKYDLQYLRRYFLDKDGKPADNPLLIGGGQYIKGTKSTPEYIDKANLNKKYARFIENLNDSNIAYPVIIEYNPNLQLTPPPLFSE